MINWTWIWSNLPTWLSGLVAGGILTLLITRYFDRVDEKRKLIAKAYKIALSWQEMLYRVRRRRGGKKEESLLVNRFHKLQEEISYYQGILSSESTFLGRSYGKLVAEIKRQNSSLIRNAWGIKPMPVHKLVYKKEIIPNVKDAEKDFLFDMRCWLSIFYLPKALVVIRNWCE